MSDTPITPQQQPLSPAQVDKFFDDLKQVANGNPLIKAKLAAAIDMDVKKASKRPPHWDVRSNVPYYKEIWARELLPLLDAMLVDGQDKEVLFSSYPALKKRTLYAKINQSWLYILDHLDPEQKYVRQRATCEARITKTGIKFFILNPDASKPLEFVSVGKDNGYVDVQNKIAQILQDEFPTMKDFEFRQIRGVTLSLDEVALLEASVASMENLAFTADETSVKLQKIPSE